MSSRESIITLQTRLITSYIETGKQGEVIYKDESQNQTRTVQEY